MEILHLIEGFGGGAAKHVIELAGLQAAAGHGVRVVHATSQIDPQTQLLMEHTTGVEWVGMDLAKSVSPLRDLADLDRIVSLVRSRRRPDVLHCHCNKAGLLGICLGPALRLPMVYTPHAFYSMQPRLHGLHRQVSLAVERLISRRASTTILLSAKEAEFARREGFAGARFRICPNGIAAGIAPVREPLTGAPVIGFLGRLTYQKGVDQLLKAMAASEARDCRIEIHGFGPEEVAVRAAEAASEGMLTFHGPAAGPAVMSRFDVLVMPSRYEGFPYVLLEALAMGLPIIATDVGGVDELVSDGWNGIILRGDPVASLVRVLDRAVTTDWRRMGKNSRLLSGFYTAQRMAERIHAIYAEVVG